MSFFLQLLYLLKSNKFIHINFSMQQSNWAACRVGVYFILNFFWLSSFRLRDVLLFSRFCLLLKKFKCRKFARKAGFPYLFFLNFHALYYSISSKFSYLFYAYFSLIIMKPSKYKHDDILLNFCQILLDH